MPKEYLQPCRLSWVRDMLRMKSNTGERFTEHDAVHSLLCDMLTGSSHSYAEYARIWNWPKSTVGDKMAELRKEAERQKRFWNEEEDDEKGDSASDGARTALGRSSDADPRSGETKGDSRTALGRRSDGARTHSISESLDLPEKEVVDAEHRAREGGDSEEKEPPSRRFAFLREDDREIYGRTIEAVAEKYSPQSLDQMIRNQWGRRSGAIPLNDFAELARGHPWSKIVAATVITADAASNPNMRYLRKVLNGFDEKPHEHANATSRNGSDAGFDYDQAIEPAR